MGGQLFDAKRDNLFLFDPEDLIIIGFDTDDGPEHELFDPRAKLPVDEKLATNIAYLGKVLEPVAVRKNGEKAEVVYGRQRVRAARLANQMLKERGAEPVRVPCQVSRADSGRVLGMMISENEHRRGETPLAKARNIARFMDHGHTEGEAAAIMGGVTVQTIRNYLALLDLDSSVQKMVEDGRISATAAGKLSSLSREEQRVQAAKLLESGKKPTAAAADRAARASKNGGEKVAAPPTKRVLRLVVKNNAGLVPEDQLPPDFVRGIRFALGELSPASVRGLTALIDPPAAE